MFFVLSKTATLLLLLSNLLIVVGLAGLALMATRWRRAGARIGLACVVLLLAAGILPVGTLLLSPLENRFPPWNAARGAPDGIVVLGGAIGPDISRDRGVSLVNGAAGRIVALAALARQFPTARIVYSGGSGDLAAGRVKEADVLGPLLDSLGVPRDRVMLENRSRNTAENAAFSKAVANPKPGERWLLVTSAAHMPRAIGCFRHAGFPVEAYPVDWRTFRHPNYQPSLLPVEGLMRTDMAVHEWLGLLSYRLTGRTDSLLPAP
jgi:uncharacterized SAM-binding protein YcdF (DUF218 family)